jgi:hypothetical protein
MKPKQQKAVHTYDDRKRYIITCKTRKQIQNGENRFLSVYRYVNVYENPRQHAVECIQYGKQIDARLTPESSRKIVEYKIISKEVFLLLSYFNTVLYQTYLSDMKPLMKMPILPHK